MGALVPPWYQRALAKLCGWIGNALLGLAYLFVAFAVGIGAGAWFLKVCERNWK